MKINLAQILGIFTLIFLISCKGNENEKMENQNPEALQDNSNLKSYSKRGGSLIDELYSELVEKNQDLKGLEAEIEIYKSKPYEDQDIFNKYDGKSNLYYRNADNYANQINDSLTKKRIIDFIKVSREKYKTKTSEIDFLLKEINSTKNTIEDNHNILKIFLTIPLIEKYQTENLPKKEKFEQTIQKQKELNGKIIKNTPKN
jgi:hypothetical protein